MVLTVIIDFNAFNKRPQEKPIILSMATPSSLSFGSQFVLQLPCVLICAIKTQQHQQQQQQQQTATSTCNSSNSIHSKLVQRPQPKKIKGADQKKDTSTSAQRSSLEIPPAASASFLLLLLFPSLICNYTEQRLGSSNNNTKKSRTTRTCLDSR